MLPVIYRITPNTVRSERARASWEGRDVVVVPAAAADSPSQKHREHACSRAHARALGAFLATGRRFAVVVEDDAILLDDSWLAHAGFDLFHPFSASREYLPRDRTVVEGLRPGFGAHTYLVGRQFATRYRALLLDGGVTDHADAALARHFCVAHSAGNLVHHDSDAPSLISEPRRKWWHTHQPNHRIPEQP